MTAQSKKCGENERKRLDIIEDDLQMLMSFTFAEHDSCLGTENADSVVNMRARIKQYFALL